MKHQDDININACELTSSDQVIAEANSALGSAQKSKLYEAPVLISYGDVRDITLGGTLGSGESGAGFEFISPFVP